MTVLDRVESATRQVDVRRAVLTALAGVLYGLGWLVASGVRLLLAALTVLLYGLGRAAGWSWAAVELGWNDALSKSARR